MVIKGDEQARKVAFNQCKQGAVRRGIPFLLTPEEYCRVVILPCYYCGNLPTMVTDSFSKNIDDVEFVHNGIDRVDNEMGYVRGNAAPCCSICNMMKRELSYSGFLDHIRKIYEYSLEHIELVKKGFVVR